MRLHLALILSLFVLVAPAARAQTPDSVTTAYDLYRLCTSRYDTDAGYCVGYVSAVADRMARASVDGYGPCVFGAARSQQFAELFKSYVTAEQDSLSLPADQVIAVSLARAFSCTRG